jgi:hypothetical protein
LGFELAEALGKNSQFPLDLTKHGHHGKVFASDWLKLKIFSETTSIHAL